MSFFSFTITPTTDAQSIVSPAILVGGNSNGLSAVKQFALKVRSMGTSTYSAVGGLNFQGTRMIAVGDNIPFTPAYSNIKISISDLFISSDTADAVIEVIGEV